jgi:uroporphyrinogen decarboxylase
MLTAMTGGVPDRVPASPDTNWMIPARLTGKPFWEVYYHGDPPIWKAYNDCVRYVGIDGFSHHGIIQAPGHPDVEGSREIVEQTDERLVVERTLRTPAGSVTGRTVFLRGEAPTQVRKPIEDFAAQFEIAKYLLWKDVDNLRLDQYTRARDDMGDDGVVGLCMNLPTLLTHLREPTEGAFFDYYDHHDLLVEYVRLWTDQLVAMARKIVDLGVEIDFVFFPNSGMITMQSVEIMRELSLPALRQLTDIFHEAGIVTSLHCCGKQRALVADAAETKLDCIDPLEVPPMGDCDLAEIKEAFGGKLALKGNLHTTEVMLRMDPDGVKREARKVLDIAKPGGGFVLSTGDQCGRDTPDANIAALVEVCEDQGRY